MQGMVPTQGLGGALKNIHHDISAIMGHQTSIHQMLAKGNVRGFGFCMGLFWGHFQLANAATALHSKCCTPPPLFANTHPLQSPIPPPPPRETVTSMFF